MISKNLSSTDKPTSSFEYEGAIISSTNIRPDEVILRNFGSKAWIIITFTDGKKIEMPLYQKSKNSGTIVIPEKFYKEAEKESEFRNLLNGLFDDQRSLEVEINDQGEKILIEPIGAKKGRFVLSFVR